MVALCVISINLMLLMLSFQIFQAKLTIIIRYFCWKHWLFIKNFHFHLQRTKRHMFKPESSIAYEDYMVNTIQHTIMLIDNVYHILNIFIINSYRFSITINKVHGCCGSMEKISTFKCCSIKRSVHYKKFRRSM